MRQLAIAGPLHNAYTSTSSIMGTPALSCMKNICKGGPKQVSCLEVGKGCSDARACDFRVWVVLRMKDNVVSGILKSRVQDIRTDSISDKAFEQVVSPSIQPSC